MAKGKKSEMKKYEEKFLGRYDLNEYYKRIVISKLNDSENKVKGQIFMIKRKSPDKLRIVKETYNTVSEEEQQLAFKRIQELYAEMVLEYMKKNRKARENNDKE